MTTRHWFRNWKASDRWSILIFLLGLVAATASVVLPILWPDKDPTHLRNATFSFYLTALFGFVVRCWVKLIDSEKKVDDLKRVVENQTMLSTLMSELVQTHPIIQDVGLKTVSAQLSSLESRKRGFDVKGTDWAMRANTNFWRAVANHAKASSRGATQVLVVHSGDTRVWAEPEALASLLAQEEFVTTAKGQIERIIVGPCAVDSIRTKLGRLEGLSIEQLFDKSFWNRAQTKENSGSEDDLSVEVYCRVLLIMAHYRVSPRYVVGVEEDYGSDFALLAPDEATTLDKSSASESRRDLVMEWVHTHDRGRVEECRFFDFADERYRTRYTALKMRGWALSDLKPSEASQPRPD
jgi:hypothetical protein